MDKIGNSLRSVRESQGYTIEDVENATKIRGHYIDCIEQGKLDAMPGAIYTIGFVRTYAKFLGLQEEEIVNAYKQYFAANTTEDIPSKKIVVQLDAAQEAKEAKHEAKHEKKPTRNTVAPPRPIHTRERSFGGKFLWVVLFLIIIFAALLLYFIGRDKTPSINDVPNSNITEPVPPVLPDEENPDGTTNPDGTINPDGTTNPDGTITNPDGTVTDPDAVVDGVAVKVSTGDSPCWVSIKIDDDTTSQETIEANQSRTYSGKEKVTIKYGNAGAVKVEVNGVLQPEIGGDGAVMTQDYTKQ